MKKVLVVLLILAMVAGSAFAEWSIGGRGSINAKIDLLDAQDNDATVGADHWFPSWGVLGGAFGLTYDRGDGFQVAFDYDQADTGGKINASLAFYGDNFAFRAVENFGSLIGTGWNDVHRLWGWYSLMDGMLYMQAAVKSEGSLSWWQPTNILGNIFDNGDWWMGGGPGLFNSFTTIGGGGGENFFVVNFTPIDGLQAGFFMPNALLGSTPVNSGTARRAEDLLADTAIGVQFDGISDLSLALQLKPNLNLDQDLAFYFGATYGLGDISLALQFNGIVDYDDSKTVAGDAVLRGTAGLGVNFRAGDFDGRVGAGLDFATDSDYDITTGFNVSLGYTIIPSTLRFSLESNVWISDTILPDNVTFMVSPAFHIDFLGTGAFGYPWGGAGTGVIIRYVYLEGGDFGNRGGDQNHVTVIFKWQL